MSYRDPDFDGQLISWHLGEQYYQPPAIVIVEDQMSAECVAMATGASAVALCGSELNPERALMPGIDGYEVCRGLKANPETLAIPVIFVTITPDVTLDHLAYAAGAIACIRKPLRREALVAVIAAALKSGGGQGVPGRN